MIRTLFLTSMILASGQAGAIPSSYSHAEQQLSVLDADPVALLDIMTLHINEHCHELSYDERDALVAQLQQIKQRLCWRPGAGLLALPMLATLAAGVTTCINYHEMRSFQAYSPLLQVFLGSEKVTDAFINSLLHFIIIAGATFMIEAEYRDTVNGLFAKERALERKIDELITLLQ